MKQSTSVFALGLSIALAASAFLSAQPKNVILFIGDGMGPEQVKAARLFAGGDLFFETFPNQALCTTYPASGPSTVTDSAAAATAIATGVKVNNGVISETSDGAPIETLLEDAQADGKAVGLVTTAYLTHATPAAFGAHTSARANYSDIGLDYRTSTKPNVLFGGNGTGLTVAQTEAAGYTVAIDTEGFQGLDLTAPLVSAPLVSAQFGSGYMPYVYDSYIPPSEESPVDYDPLSTYPYPMLNEMVVSALDALDGDPDDDPPGFFLMVEGGRIDHACHAGLLKHSIHETLAFADAVEAAMLWASGRTDTLILVTADHETGGLTVGSGFDGDGYPNATFSSGSHTGANVPVYAWGENAELVGSLMDNTDFFEVCTIDTAPVYAATNPFPADQSTDEPVNIVLSWTAGLGAVSHEVYLSEDPAFTGVAAITTTGTAHDPGGSLLPGTTYYWRVDEVAADSIKAEGPPWTFTTTLPPEAATNPSPTLGATEVPANILLTWDSGLRSESEVVWFGTDPGAMSEVTAVGNSYDPGTLTTETTYYWKIVSWNDPMFAETAVHSFTTTTPPGPATALNPLAGAIAIPIDTQLSWQAAPRATSYEVWMGASPATLELLDTTTDTAYSPGALDHLTTYDWKIVSVNEAGSADSIVHSFTTADVPPPVPVFAQGESSLKGSVTGTLENLLAADGVYEELTEVLNVSNKNGYSTLDHTWTFQMIPNTSAIFYVSAFHSENSEGDDFTFSYSTDAVTFHPMLTVTKTTDNGSLQSFELPAGLSGTVSIRVVDTDHTKKNQIPDTLWVDQMFIQTTLGGVIKNYPATQPQPADGATGISPEAGLVLAWTPGDDAVYHDLYLGTDPVAMTAPTVAALTDPSAQVVDALGPLTTYYWWIDERDVDNNLLVEGTVWSFTTGPDPNSEPSTVTVDSVAVDTVKGDKGMAYVRATVTLINDFGQPVAGAIVTGAFDADDSATVSGTTDESGIAVLQSNTQARKPLMGFSVTGVQASGLTYDPLM